ncbi:hypothetical protein EBS43_01350 [bacterium]|jgi:hypothetical protein|nr:hypothetical protein [bacterium]
MIMMGRIFMIGALFVFAFQMGPLVLAKEAGDSKSSRKTQLDFEGASIEGEIRSPGEFYFQRKSDEKMNSLVKRRSHFHRQILRDVVLSK